MSSRKVTLRVQCDLPNDIAVDEFKAFVFSSLQGNCSTYLDDETIGSITVKRTYQRK